MWIYKDISRSEFERRKDFVERVMRDLGCEPIQISEHTVYRFKDEFYRVDEVLFPEKPFIVLEYADTEDKVMKNIMEDCEPFPYDLSDDEITNEVRYSLGIEQYPKN